VKRKRDIKRYWGRESGRIAAKEVDKSISATAGLKGKAQLDQSLCPNLLSTPVSNRGNAARRMRLKQDER